ncbi:MAG: type II secretion system F family protein [Halobacteriovoraceae bacterium]|nr:type II secretion system F family protein [Halobacteriovoraceae bacterium]
MAIYKYTAINKLGKEVVANINADSTAQAKLILKAQGFMLLNIKEQKSDRMKEKSTFSFGSGVSVADLSMMTRQLATLIKARIQIVESLQALVDQTENPHLRLALSDIKKKVNEGSSLAKAMADYPKVFDHVFVNMVEAGESSGTLDIVLIRLAEFTESQVKLKNKIKGAMTYPIIIFSFTGIIMLGIFLFIMPQITKLFTSRKINLPWMTEVCIWISDVLRQYWLLIILAILSSIFLFRKYINSQKGKRNWHHVLLIMPIVKDLTIMINISRFCSTLSTLLNSGVPIMAALRIVKNLVGNIHMQELVDSARDNVSQGGLMSTALAEGQLFPTMVTHMMKLGEQSGEVEEMLTIIAENYNDQVNNKLDGLTSIIEPIMMIGLGAAVGFIVLSVVMPIMELNNMR